VHALCENTAAFWRGHPDHRLPLKVFCCGTHTRARARIDYRSIWKKASSGGGSNSRTLRDCDSEAIGAKAAKRRQMCTARDEK